MIKNGTIFISELNNEKIIVTHAKYSEQTNDTILQLGNPILVKCGYFYEVNPGDFVILSI